MPRTSGTADDGVMDPADAKLCRACERPSPAGEVRYCAKCGTTYCSEACQAADWNTNRHGERCAEIAALVAEYVAKLREFVADCLAFEAVEKTSGFGKKRKKKEDEDESDEEEEEEEPPKKKLRADARELAAAAAELRAAAGGAAASVAQQRATLGVVGGMPLNTLTSVCDVVANQLPREAYAPFFRDLFDALPFATRVGIYPHLPSFIAILQAVLDREPSFAPAYKQYGAMIRALASEDARRVKFGGTITWNAMKRGLPRSGTDALRLDLCEATVVIAQRDDDESMYRDPPLLACEDRVRRAARAGARRFVFRGMTAYDVYDFETFAKRGITSKEQQDAAFSEPFPGGGRPYEVRHQICGGMTRLLRRFATISTLVIDNEHHYPPERETRWEDLADLLALGGVRKVQIDLQYFGESEYKKLDQLDFLICVASRPHAWAPALADGTICLAEGVRASGGLTMRPSMFDPSSAWSARMDERAIRQALIDRSPAQAARFLIEIAVDALGHRIPIGRLVFRGYASGKEAKPSSHRRELEGLATLLFEPRSVRRASSFEPVLGVGGTFVLGL